MQPDTDYLDTQRQTRRERWRCNLAAMALIGCVAMLVMATAPPLEAADDPAIHCPRTLPEPETLPGGNGITPARGERDTAFKFPDHTLCSGREKHATH